jgi:cytochrome b561
VSTHRHYTRTAKLLHWLMAALIVGLIGLGLYMEGLPFSPDKLKFYAWHKWAGVTAFALVLGRLAWRTLHRPPPLPAGMTPHQRLAAHAGHVLLYVMMIAIPVSGWLMSSAKGVPTVWFGVVPLPDLVAKSEALGEFLQTTHKYLNWLLIAVLAGHIGAALKHHFIDRDDVLVRMLPNLRSESSS